MANYPVKHTFTKGDTDASRSYTLKENGAVLNLTGYSGVKLFAWHRNTDAAVNPAGLAGTITTPASGLITFDHATIAAAVGTYYAQIETTTTLGSKVRRTPYFGLEVLEQVEDL